MEMYFADDTFLVYLMGQAYKMWDMFYPHVASLPNQAAIYLYCPFEFVPNKYINTSLSFDL